MGIDPRHLREHVIVPALQAIDLYSPTAADLVLGTACQESQCGHYLTQLGAGPARGIFQMEPATHDDIWQNFVAYKPYLREGLKGISLTQEADEMRWNLLYAAAMCRVHYFRVKAALPIVGNLRGQASYWKRFYNTEAGKGTVQEYIENWRRYAA